MANKIVKTTPNQTAKALENNLNGEQALLMIMVNELNNGKNCYRFHLNDETKLIKALTDCALVTGHHRKTLGFIRKSIALFRFAERHIEYELERQSKFN